MSLGLFTILGTKWITHSKSAFTNKLNDPLSVQKSEVITFHLNLDEVPPIAI